MYRVVLCFCVFIFASVSGENSTDDGPVVSTPMGPILGSWMESRRGRRFEAYRGIPYAEAPVGPLRFQPPKPVEKYSTQVDGSKEGPACPQQAREGYYIDEDCLRINVYTPMRNSSSRLPVIFFIPPGGFYSMSGRSDLAGPHYLMDRDVVLVTFNYRLGALGFLALGTVQAPGNNGLKDQVVALKWVQENIASFGGDPNLVTIAGISAGSLSVMLHMISPMSKGLFHRGISISGSPVSKVPSPPHRLDLAIKQAQISKCPTDTPEAIYDCLKTKPWKEIAGSLKGFIEFAFDPLVLWRPVIEPDFGQERFLPIEPIVAIGDGHMHPVPFIISQTTDEVFWKAYTVLNYDNFRNTMNDEWERIAPISFILPRNNSSSVVKRLRTAYLRYQPLTKNENITRELGQLYGDAIIGFPVHRMAFLMCLHSTQPVWYSNFDYIGNHSHYEDPYTKKPVGVAHRDDMIYLFSLSYQFPSINVSDSEDSKMVDKMTAIWYNFARFGDPNPCKECNTPELSSLSWPKFTNLNNERKYLRIGNSFSVGRKMFENRFEVWEDLYPIRYDESSDERHTNDSRFSNDIETSSMRSTDGSISIGSRIASSIDSYMKLVVTQIVKYLSIIFHSNDSFP